MRLATLLVIGLLLLASSALAEKAPYNYGTYNGLVERQGGDTVATATPITALPFSGAGTTVGYANNYDAVCPYTNSTSPDVVYSFTPGVTCLLDITLCAGSLYDTKLYVLDAGLSVVACNDDFCPGYVSELVTANGTAVPVTAGALYYIVVDGYGGASGTYTIDITGDCFTPTEESSFSTVKSLF
jgi:hypothetical protein